MPAETFDLADTDFLADPAPMLARMREAGALVPVRVPVLGRILVTTTHAATAEVAKGKDRFFLTSAGAGTGRRGFAAMPWWAPPTLRAIGRNMLGMDDPEHRRLRRLVDRAFARRGIRDMRPAIAERADRAAADLGEGIVDLVPHFSRRFPLDIIAELLGIPEDARPRFARYGGALGDLAGPLSIWRLLRSTGRLRADLVRLVKDRRVSPGPGLIGELIAVEEAGDRLSEDELIAMVFLLLLAGFETTTNLISGAVVALERNPAQKAWLFDDFDARIETATEELCRHVSAVAGTKPRICAGDTTVDGQAVARGQKVMALPIAANYDPAVFDTPGELRLDRFPNPHLAFSTGAHFCLGMQLARVELQEALRALYTRHPTLSLGEGPLDYARRPGHRALSSLSVSLSS